MAFLDRLLARTPGISSRQLRAGILILNQWLNQRNRRFPTAALSWQGRRVAPCCHPPSLIDRIDEDLE